MKIGEFWESAPGEASSSAGQAPGLSALFTEEAKTVTNVELRIDARAIVGEGAIWDDEKQVLYWVDIMGNSLYAYDPVADKNTAYHVGQHVGTVVPKNEAEVMVAVYEGFATFKLASQELALINNPEAGLPDNRFNDGKCDPAGRFWAGTMAYQNQSTQGALYRMDPDYSVHKMVGNVGISNGLAWSLDQATMYYIDSIPYNVKAYDFDLETGNIGQERIIIDVPQEAGMPDGMTIDEEGMLWIAHFGGGRVCRWHPDSGELLQTIHLPVSQITSCAFGDKELDTLYITSAAIRRSEGAPEEPHAGALFSIKPGCRGLQSFRFGG
jgi:sugar lactone lactonase YvrE